MSFCTYGIAEYHGVQSRMRSCYTYLVHREWHSLSSESLKMSVTVIWYLVQGFSMVCRSCQISAKIACSGNREWYS